MAADDRQRCNSGSSRFGTASDADATRTPRSQKRAGFRRRFCTTVIVGTKRAVMRPLPLRAAEAARRGPYSRPRPAPGCNGLLLITVQNRPHIPNGVWMRRSRSKCEEEPACAGPSDFRIAAATLTPPAAAPWAQAGGRQARWPRPGPPASRARRGSTCRAWRRLRGSWSSRRQCLPGSAGRQ